MGHGISRMEIRRFEQSALLIPAEDLPTEITIESRRALINDLITLAKNKNPSDQGRKPLADSLVVRMKELMQRYCDIAQSKPDRYGPEYLKEFEQRLKSARAVPDCVIRENSKAIPTALVGLFLYLFGAMMRMRYD